MAGERSACDDIAVCESSAPMIARINSDPISGEMPICASLLLSACCCNLVHSISVPMKT